MTTQELLNALDALEAPTPADYAVMELRKIIYTLLDREAYKVTELLVPVNGLDFLGSTQRDGRPFRIGVQTKIASGHPMPLDFIWRDVERAMSYGANRLLFVTNARLTSDAQAEIARGIPIDVEIVDFQRLKNWIRKLDQTSGDGQEIIELRSAFSLRLAELIAKKPEYLQQVEWRELEHVLCEILKGLGYDAELTRSTKDKGRDILLNCSRNGVPPTYAIEVKHWREKRVGSNVVSDFLRVIVEEKHERGLLVATGGFSLTAFEQLSEIEKRRIHAATGAKVVSLCQTYVRSKGGIYSPPSVAKILFETDA